MIDRDVPDAELMIATGCAHCPMVLSALAELLKKGQIGRLVVTNIATHPEVADARGVRGVPWIRVGPFEFTGAHSQGELADWAARAGSEEGIQRYLEVGLETGQLAAVTSACRNSPAMLPQLVRLAGDLEMAFAVRIGVGAVLEDLATEGLLLGLVDDFAALASSPHAQVRADAAHFLGLSGAPEAEPHLRSLADDADREVREIAAESLALLGGRGGVDQQSPAQEL
jgi:hypothetical protein